jgi:hypothetical protein
MQLERYAVIAIYTLYGWAWHMRSSRWDGTEQNRTETSGCSLKQCDGGKGFRRSCEDVYQQHFLLVVQQWNLKEW